MHKDSVALLLALASQAAWAHPPRTLPRLPLARVEARAASAKAAERFHARDASGPILEPPARLPADAAAPDANPTETRTVISGDAVAEAPAFTSSTAERNGAGGATPTAITIVTRTTISTVTPTTVTIVTPTTITTATMTGVAPVASATPPGQGTLTIEVAPALETASDRVPPRETAASKPRTPEAGLAEPHPEIQPAELVTQAKPASDDLDTVRETHQPDGRTLQLVRSRSGAIIEILRDAQGRLLSARDATP